MSKRALRRARSMGLGSVRKGGGNGPPPRMRGVSEINERGIPGFARLRYKTKLNYFDSVALSTGAGSAGTYIISANGLYDPDITGTGHQPMPFDQIMLSYEHYCVIKSKITVQFRNSSTTNSVGCGISLNSGTTAVTAIQALIENGVMVRDKLNVSPASNSLMTLELPCDVAVFGTVPDLLDNPSYQGSVAANPAEQVYFHLSVWQAEGVALVNTQLEWFVEYEAVFSEPRKNSVSLNKQIHLLVEQSELEQMVMVAPACDSKTGEHETLSQRARKCGVG